MHLSRWALKSYEMPTLDSSLSVKDVPSSMFSYESLWILQTVCLHLDGHHMVTWDHGQTQNSGLSLGESVWNHRRIDHFQFEIYSAIQYPIKGDYCAHIYTKVPFIFGK